MGSPRPAPHAQDHRRRLGRRAGWTVADQAISSIANAGLAILVARSVTAEAFGAFSIAYMLFSFLIGLTRAIVTDPLVIRFSGADAGSLQRSARQSAGASLLIGVVLGGVCVFVGWLLGGNLGDSILALGLFLPFLLVQDAWRHAFFAGRRPAAATLNDGVWAVVQFGGMGVLISTGHGSVFLLMLAWGTGALAGTLLGAWQMAAGTPDAMAWPRPRMGPRWLRRQAELGTRLGGDFAINLGAFHLASVMVGAVAGLAAAGFLRAAQTLLGPLQTLFSAVTTFALPVMASRAWQGGPRLIRPAMAIAAIAGAISAVWVFLLLLLPDSVGEQLLGDSWAGARSVLLAVGVMTTVVAVATGPVLLLKALGEAATLLRVTLIQAPLVIILGVAGAVWSGPTAAAWGLAIAHVVGCGLAWLAALRTREQRAIPLGAIPASS